ncbi:MAG: gephyrin-like molybdotransferase Glp [Chroococcales cyanobacterium]
MLPVKDAESLILSLIQPLSPQEDIEIVKLNAAVSRILAQPVTSQLDFPHWDNSAMDGYAVRFADVHECNSHNPAILEIVEEIPAGYSPKVSIDSGQAARIFTGAVMPKGADTIVIQENTEREGNSVKILESPEKNAFVRSRASFYKAGEELLPAGLKIGAPEIAVLAAAQCTELEVYRRPRVAILSTGDELVTPEQPLQAGQIVDSNQYALTAFVVANGCIPIPLGIVPDQPTQLKDAIANAIQQADVVLSTGGVSVGEYDYVDSILAELGGEIAIRSVAVKPGKPLTVATFKQAQKSCLYFGIPGNPVSALVSCWRFVQPALKKLSGISGDCFPTFVKARSRHDLRAGGKRETYLWGQLQIVEGYYEFSLAGGSHSSGNLINLAQTNGLAVVPIGINSIPSGEIVDVMLIND